MKKMCLSVALGFLFGAGALLAAGLLYPAFRAEGSRSAAQPLSNGAGALPTRNAGKLPTPQPHTEIRLRADGKDAQITLVTSDGVIQLGE